MSDQHGMFGEDCAPPGPPPAPPTVPEAAAFIPFARPIDIRHPIYLANVRPAAAWADIGLCVLLLFGTSLVLGVVLGTVATVFGVQDERNLTVLGLPFQAALWIAVILAILSYRRQGPASVALTADRAAVNCLLGPVVGVLAGVVWLGTAPIMYVIWREGFEQLQSNADAITEMLPPLHPAWLVGLQFIVALYEELVFRGFLLTRLRRGLGSWWPAVVLSSVLFALPHALDQELPAIVPLFFLGCLFCVVTIWRKSLIPSVIGHALFNAGNLLMLYYYERPDWT